MSEVYELTSDSGFQCQNWVELKTFGATGGLLGNTPLICGGFTNGNTSDTCYALNKDKATNATTMLVKRLYSTSIILDSNILWITGGKNFEAELVHSSSEYVTVRYTSPGPELPRPLYKHAMVSVPGDLTFVVGGVNSNGTHTDSNMTHIYNHKTERWTNGPPLNMGRVSHSAFIVTDLVTDERFVIVAGGYQKDLSLNSTEILIEDRFGDRWIKGTK